MAGLTKEQILSYPAMGYVYGQFTAILNKYVDKYNKQDKFFLACYNNASFDNQFLRAWFLQNGDKYFYTECLCYSSLLVIIMLHLITSFSVHGFYRMGINISDLTSIELVMSSTMERRLFTSESVSRAIF